MSGTVVVHDRYQNYDAFPGPIHQLCSAHLSRDLEAAAQEYSDARWPVEMRQALQCLIHAANAVRGQSPAAIPDEAAARLVHALRHGVLLGLKEVRKIPGRKQEPFRELLECLRDRQDDMLRFITHRRIPPTSNRVDPDLRPKTQQKISGRLRSEQAARHGYAIRGYIDTTAKHGISVITATRDDLAREPLDATHPRPRPDQSSRSPSRHPGKSSHPSESLNGYPASICSPKKVIRGPTS
jgi:hypothetical protein